jgi:hypothetical protein
MQLQTFGAWSASILSIGAGALTQSPEYSFLALPVAIASAIAWLVVLAVFIYRNRHRISRRWKMIIGFALLFGGCVISTIGLTIIASGTSDNAVIAKLTPHSGSPFKVEDQIYVESLEIQRTDGKKTEFFQNTFYLVVGNRSQDGKTLREVQARVQSYETPVRLASIAGTTSSFTDIQHGEYAFFQIGKIVSTKRYGPYKGAIGLSNLTEYDHNIPLGVLTFEVWSSDSKRQFTLNQWPDRAANWTVPVVISASDIKSVQVAIDVNLNGDKSSVSILSEGPEDEKAKVSQR